MGVLYIVSKEERAGKTAICAGIAVNLRSAGKKTGYLKPQATAKELEDGDTGFMKKALGLNDLVNAPDLIAGRDVVLVEFMLGKKADDAVSKAAYSTAKDMKARTVAVETYTEKIQDNAALYKGFGEGFVGVIINKAPQSQLKRVKEAAARAGIKLLGVIPENRLLLSLTVGELGESIKGKILNGADKAGEAVENYMLGAMVVDSGLTYFSRKNRKAAIIHGDRPDMQLAALETPTTCLVLSGGSQPPLYSVLNKAQNKGVPVITTDTPVSDIVTNIENTLQTTRLHQEKKLAKLAEIIKQNLDLKIFA